MPEPDFTLALDGGLDDLPRTLRREHEAREREARQRATSSPQVYAKGDQSGPLTQEPLPATVKRFDVPFIELMMFFIKAVFAAVPALIILGVILWCVGHLLQIYFPQIIKMQILIRFPNG